MIGKNLLLWLVIGITMVSLFNMFNPPHAPGESMSYSAFVEKVNGGMVETAKIREHEISGQYRNLQGDLRTYQVTTPDDPGLTQRLLDQHVEVDVSKPEEVPFLLSVLISWFPMLLLIAVWVFFMRQMQGGG
ncbi:MAG: ATP-dependent metallopeptidase FtsH/Yme1/Tma family protein, partial [Mariprofundaceae bacterium]|nr:ATP-dependent metallopeptidase FtsH/Yme1/Tma family protein [Mariprofundaceae bacterium]